MNEQLPVTLYTEQGAPYRVLREDRPRRPPPWFTLELRDDGAIWYVPWEAPQ